MKYSQKYYPGTREELVSKIKTAMSPRRFQHVLGVEQAAIQLAKDNQADVEKASIAALVHDYAKERSDSDFQAVIQTKHLDPDLLRWDNFIWHGVVGAEMIATELGITDPEILDAVRKHTVGAKDMTLLDRIIYVADYIEPGRDFPGVQEARLIAQKDLNEAVSYETQHTLEHLLQMKKVIYPAAMETYNYWVAGKLD
ncbi:bis(5'-nucleosyl)-tetraphosphatase (symmetrical) YqeK [Lactobacillus ceti]|uniref:bis(5'-nucleosyl)-tetraphosphatase (symmetrical) YqeK n=1 Tax=Ligilactobacillus ceti TaxID=395085 RepID=UPI000484E8A1